MTDVLKMSRKALTVGVVLTTILWSMMASVLVAPLKASAAGCTSGTLIKGSLSAVYYCGADQKRYVFTNDKAYFTWYADFSGVTKISDADLASIQIGGNVTYRPGVKMVKIQTDPKVYALAHGGVLRPIASEAVASCLYGATWNKQIDDISDAFFTNYSVGNAINVCGDYNKTAEMSGSQSVNQDKGLSLTGTTSGLSVSLASDSPASATVPKGATGVNFVKFNVSNGTGSAAAIDSVVVHRMGAGAPSDFSSVYLYEGDVRLTTGRSVNTSSNDVTFNSLNLSVAAGSTRTFWVAATMSTTAAAGNVNAFQVTSVMSGTSNAVGLPVSGNNMTMAGATVGSVTITKSGTITNPKVGQMNAKVGEFQLSAGSSEDLMIKRITLFQGGSLSRSNLTNLKLKTGGTDIASAAGVDSKDHIVFVLTSASLLEKGNTRTFEVWGDIGAGSRADESLKLSVEEDLDVTATGNTYGFGVTVNREAADSPAGSYDGTSCTSTSGLCSYSVVEGGQVTITFNGPASKNVAVNSKDQEVLNFTMVSQANVEVRKVVLTLTATGDGLKSATPTANYTDVKVTDVSSGVTVTSAQDVSTSGDDTTQDLTYTDVFTLTAGVARTFKVTMDVANNTALDADTVHVDLAGFGSTDIRNLDNSTYVASANIVPSSDIVGNTETIASSSLVLSPASTPVAQTYIQGSQNVDLFALNMKAGDASDIRVTSITLTGFVDATTDEYTQGENIDGGETKKLTDILSTAKLLKTDGSQVGDVKSPTSSSAESTGGQLQFTNLNLLVPKGQTVTLTLKGNLASSIANLSDLIKFEVLQNADVSAQDQDSNALVAGTNLTGAASFGSAMTIASSGTMTYALASNDSESSAGLVLGGSTSVLAKYDFTAQNEDLKLDKVRIHLTDSGTTSAILAAVNQVWLYDGATPVAGPVTPNSSGNADFSGFAFLVPKDASKTLTVKAALNSVSASGAASGLNLQVTLCSGSNVGICQVGAGVDPDGTYEVRGTSAGSSTLDTVGNSGNISGNEKIIRKTKPTVSLVALPSSTLNNGTNVISRFTVTADAAQKISLKKLTFELNLNDISGNDLTVATTSLESGIKELGGDGTFIGGAMIASGTCTDTGTCTVSSYFTSEQTVGTVGVGGSKTYELYMTIAGANAAGESITSKLLGDTAQVTGELDGYADPAFLVIDDLDSSAANAAYNFIWSDNSSIPHNDTVDGNDIATDDATASNDWTNGRFVKVLPTSTQTMSF